MLLRKEPQKEELSADALGENNLSDVKRDLCLGSLDPNSCLKKDHCFYPGTVCFKRSKKYILKDSSRTSLVVQWVRLHAPNAGGLGSIPGQGTGCHMHVATKSSNATTKDPIRGNEDSVGRN